MGTWILRVYATKKTQFLVSRIDRFQNAKGRMIINGDDRNDIAGEMWIAEFERCVQKQSWAGACYEAIGGYVPVCCHRSEIIESTSYAMCWVGWLQHTWRSIAHGSRFCLCTCGAFKRIQFLRVFEVLFFNIKGNFPDPREDPKSRSLHGGSYKVPFGSFMGFLQESFKEGCLSGSVQGFLVPSWVTT